MKPPRGSDPAGSDPSGTVLLATRNPGKARELQRLLKPLDVRVLTLESFPGVPLVVEDKHTLEENAVKKAAETWLHVDLPVLADDSGLEVEALGGRPGVHSARFAGAAQDDRANVAKLLKLLRGVPPSRRKARFVCVLAFARGGRIIKTFRGACEGSIALAPSGRAGFGYDPVFIPAGRKKTLAELGPGVKDRLSHRVRAVRAFARWLRKDLSGGPAG